MLSHLFDDLRHGLRVLAAKPGFTLVAVLTLALGIGANTLVFTLIDGVYLGALPYRDAGQLVDLYAAWGAAVPTTCRFPTTWTCIATSRLCPTAGCTAM